MHVEIMRNTMSTCAQYGIVAVHITLFFQCRDLNSVVFFYMENVRHMCFPIQKHIETHVF
jgi:hypothetical protein